MQHLSSRFVPAAIMILGHRFTNFVLSLILVAAGIHSFHAIQGSSKSEKKHWLTFWTLYACVQAMEFAIDILLHWMPFYQEIKLGVYVYLAFYNGTAVVYESYGKEAFQAMEDGVTQLHEQVCFKGWGRE